jgi:uncharacterized phosphosugar-binding protein
MTSQMERLEGFGTIIARNTKMQKDDLIIIHSVSGRNPVAIDVALEAKKIGVTVICLTNVKYSMSVASRHSSGKRLLDIADLVIDKINGIHDDEYYAEQEIITEKKVMEFTFSSIEDIRFKLLPWLEGFINFMAGEFSNIGYL